MATFKQYQKKNGQKAWMFTSYLGVDENGKQLNVTRRGFKTQREAKIALSLIESGVDQVKPKEEKKQHTYQEVYDLWFVEYSQTVKPSTLMKTERLFKNHILPAFGERTINNILPLDVQDVMNQWHKKLVRGSSVMNYAGMVFDYALRLQLITSNPTKIIKKPVRLKKVKEDKDLNFYDKEELKTFLEALEKSNHEKSRVLFRILAFTGMRKGEAFALKWSDIDTANKTMNINKAVARNEFGLYIDTPKNPSSIRRISLDDKTLEIINAFRYDKDDDELIFLSDDGGITQPSKSRKWLLPIQNKTKLKKITTHGFRHTHASLLFDAGASIKDVQLRLGHTDIQTTMDIYTHVTKHAREKLAEKFNDYIDF